MPKRKVVEPDAEQHRRFVEAARELGCDESEERFAEVVKKVAGAKPRAAASQGSRGEPRKPAQPR